MHWSGLLSLSKKKPSYSSLPENNNRVLILSVDDEEVNQTVLRTLMPEVQYEVVSAYDGFEALMYLNDCRALPDIMLLDIMMPGMSGFEVCSKVREEYSSSELPVIIISAKTTEEDIIRGLGCGANDYLTKPIRHLELQARITTQLAAKKAMSAEAEAASHHALLAKMLPDNVISRLKNGSQLIAEKHLEVTILFSDIVNFTTMASVWPTERIVMLLDEMFTAFDGLCDRHGVYKVETIGDAYMVVCGHRGEADHAVRVVNMALSMLEAISSLHSMQQGDPVRIRIGVHSGPAHSGVVGVKCPRYCFFGDTVNTASRMESHGFPMTIHCSSATRSLLSNHPTLDFVEFGPRLIKGKGLMTTYVVKAGDWQAALDAAPDPAASTSLASMLLDTHASNISLDTTDSIPDTASITPLSRSNTGLSIPPLSRSNTSLSIPAPSDTSDPTSPPGITLQLPPHAAPRCPADAPPLGVSTSNSSTATHHPSPAMAAPSPQLPVAVAPVAQSLASPSPATATPVSSTPEAVTASPHLQATSLHCPSTSSSCKPDSPAATLQTPASGARPAAQRQSPSPTTPVPSTPPSPFLPSSRLPFGPLPPPDTFPRPANTANGKPSNRNTVAPSTAQPTACKVNSARPALSTPLTPTHATPLPDLANAPQHPTPSPSTTCHPPTSPTIQPSGLLTGLSFPQPPPHILSNPSEAAEAPKPPTLRLNSNQWPVVHTSSGHSLTSPTTPLLGLVTQSSGHSLTSPTTPLLGLVTQSSKGSAASPTRAQEWFHKQRLARAIASAEALQQQGDAGT